MRFSIPSPSTSRFLRISPRANMPSPPSRYRVTFIYLVPSLVHQIVHHPRFPTTDFSAVQVLHCGAAHLPVSLSEQLRSRFPGVDRMSEGRRMTTSLSYSSTDDEH